MSSITRSILTSKTPTRPTLTRKKSQYFTDQWNEKTCGAHTSSILIGRLLKLYFSEYFGKEIEWCDYYYNTLLCNNGDIFECFKNDKMNLKTEWNCKNYVFNNLNKFKKKSRKKEAALLFYEELVLESYEESRDEEGWNNENLSALLFYFIYTIITDKYLFHGINVVLSIILIFEFFRTTIITNEVVAAKLKYDATKWINETDKNYFNTIILQLTTMLLKVQTKLKDGSFNPNLYYASRLNYTIVNPIIIYNYKTYWPSIEKSLKTTSISLKVIGHKLATLHQTRLWRKDNMLIIKTHLLSVLKKGLYVIIIVSRKQLEKEKKKFLHAMILNGVETGKDGKKYFTIKNSWGRYGDPYFLQSGNNKIEMDRFFKMYKNKFETMLYSYEFEMIFFDTTDFDTITSNKEPFIDQDSLLYAGGKQQTSKNRKYRKKTQTKFKTH